MISHVSEVHLIPLAAGRRSLRNRAKAHSGSSLAAAYHVQLIIKDEEIARSSGLRIRLGLEHLDWIDLEEIR